MNAETSGMIGTRFLSKCAKRPLLINVSRGGLVDNAALAVALDAGMIRGAALDVVDGEPSPPQSLLNLTDVIITPHVAYASTAAMVELRTRACEEVIRTLRGEQPRNACNTPRVT
ncbi:NAD(P)-dependent oxidoreductase [Mesorhizobium sp.]|uniref:NAD(P)-dependent oxidoreductase n=1 Tax=Mesorhizobium sp. TaxID=1871066 RepID=UPI0025F4CE81|nr:NAD(P)-dependent oxidoreductase [Mesorhizobium sp.]